MLSITPHSFELKEALAFSEIVHPLMRLIEIIREYAVEFFLFIGSFLALAPFKWGLSFSGKDRKVGASLSINLKKIFKFLPFKMWRPDIKISMSCKLKKS